ncbi:hypothetical protein Asppvi_010148 [Aspergillus pseudoviridinutans]|uniref:Fungal calcium binding protein domain-containing protein n=1 Tax=Aspergillus pseudoviridinutans TaxID=1517512 RepID=A0A9P3BLJ7_9EURO|nr:uncharacterized protein Asppvi_010148 [Aspergillus pseudoviridinutans]GIJ91183.1 hypothetical protein Asppvi_010148 [Aspergillus pseudoviridinutans]
MQLSKTIIFCFLALQTAYALPVANPDPQSLQEICCSLLDEMFAAASAATTAAKEAAEMQLGMAMMGSLGNVVGNGAIDCEAACQIH